ncbi:MAG TPA: porphobilinogen synthase [Alphaproteobacteria bacterium]|nr:porphobilinogen synthase [Alphaproteobacteria bacterium]
MNIRAILDGLPQSAGSEKAPLGAYPRTRLRRMRGDDWSRRLMRETQLSVNDLIWPIFVQAGDAAETPVPSMPGVVRYSVKRAVEAVGEAAALGIPAIAVFPVVDPALKTEDGREAFNSANVVCQAVRAIKAAHPAIGVICDAALDPFTSHGQDGILRGGEVINDETIAALIRQSLVQAEAGCDVIAPSDMMDGRVGAIRDALEAQGFTHVKILAYSAKYASAFYGPFRDAVGSGTALGLKGKQTYQMDPANGDEALRETALDIAEGADMVMVKPGLPYLDVLWRVKDAFKLPTFAYHVSGEWAMLKAASANGWLDGDKALMETLACFKRAGADGILTYGAIDAAKRLKSGG